MPRTLLFVQAGHEVHVGAKPERTDLARIFIVFALRPLSLVLFLSRTQAQKRGNGGILLGPVSSWLASWGLIQLGDFHSPQISREKNLVMHQCLTVSQVTGMASGRKLQYSPFTQVQIISKHILYNVMLHTATVD